jgi:hypothetical protein
MKPQDIFEIAIVAVVAIGAAPFLAAYMARVYSGEKHPSALPRSRRGALL